MSPRLQHDRRRRPARSGRTAAAALAPRVLLGILLGIGGPATLPAAATTRATDDAEGTAWMPDDVDLIVVARDLGAWWNAPGVRGLTAMLERRLVASELGNLWRDLALASGFDGAELAERLLSEELVLGLPLDDRATTTPPRTPTWIASMRVDEATRRDLLSRLPLRPLGGGRYELRGHDVLIVDRPPHLLAGPNEVVGRLPRGRLERGLETGAAARPAHPRPTHLRIEVRRGLAMAPMRIDAAVEGRSISIRGMQTGRSSGTSSTLELDPAMSDVLDELRRRHAVVVASVAGGPSPVGLEWIAVLPELAVPPSLGGCVRERRVWTIGETRGDASDRWREHATPALVAAFEVEDAQEGRRRLDAWADGLAQALDRRFERLALPKVEVLRTFDGGTIPLASIARAMVGGHALAERLRLDWSSASGPCGDWAIVGTGGAYLRDVRDAFEPALAETRSTIALDPDRDSKDIDDAAGWRLVQMGWIDSNRITGHLGRWCDRGLDLFDPARAERLRPNLERMLEASSAMRRIRWSIEENASGDRRFDVRLDSIPDPATGP